MMPHISLTRCLLSRRYYQFYLTLTSGVTLISIKDL